MSSTTAAARRYYPTSSTALLSSSQLQSNNNGVRQNRKQQGKATTVLERFHASTSTSANLLPHDHHHHHHTRVHPTTTVTHCGDHLEHEEATHPFPVSRRLSEELESHHQYGGGSLLGSPLTSPAVVVGVTTAPEGTVRSSTGRRAGTNPSYPPSFQQYLVSATSGDEQFVSTVTNTSQQSTTSDDAQPQQQSSEDDTIMDVDSEDNVSAEGDQEREGANDDFRDHTIEGGEEDFSPTTAHKPHSSATTHTRSHPQQQEKLFTTAAVGDVVVSVQGHVVCTHKPVSGSGGLFHTVNTEHRPFTRRTALAVPQKLFEGFLTKQGVALQQLHQAPHPNVLKMVTAIEPTDDQDGYIICPQLYQDLGAWMIQMTEPGSVSLQKKLDIARQTISAVAHCHKAGVALGKVDRRSFCWTDSTCTSLVFAGLRSMHYVGYDRTSRLVKEAFAKDLKALAIMLLRVFGTQSSAGIKRASLPDPIRDMLKELLACNVATEEDILRKWSDYCLTMMYTPQQLQQQTTTTKPNKKKEMSALGEQIVPEMTQAVFPAKNPAAAVAPSSSSRKRKHAATTQDRGTKNISVAVCSADKKTKTSF